MQPPIPAGTVLQSRYHVVRLLGQGGFGRTYLSEDQGRFNESCALKEFVPLQGEDRFSDKATQLFQREASILYQIQHPQIPQFRATFEQDQRLFLVQDYIDGINYRDLLNQRRSQSNAFSETEVRQFLRQILPVLAHIHAKGIIHRDISPDNIILRSSDRLPILIDFGVVKEVVTRIQLPDTATQATTVGKLGYAPSEQMQTGRAYPSSDLYSLAVTSIVLLTGKEPQDMFDDVNLIWHWQDIARVSSPFAQVLNRALSYRPGDRYQSVSEMAQALGALDQAPAGPTAYATPSAFAQPGAVPPPVSHAASPPSVSPPNVSQMKTVAVGRRYEPTVARPAAARNIPARTTPARTAPARQKLPPNQQDTSIWENPLAVTALGIGLALVAGTGGWAVVSALSNRPEPAPSEVPGPSITLDPPSQEQSSPDPDPTPPTSEPVEYSQTLNIRPGRNTTVNGDLKTGETINYRVTGEEGQTLEAALEGDGVLLTVLGPDGEVIDDAERVTTWQGTLPTTGEYTVQLKTVEGVDESNYGLTVSLAATEDGADGEPDDPDAETEPGTDAETEPEVTQTDIQRQRVQFPQDSTETRLANDVGRGRVRRYVVNASEGQVMAVQLSNMSGPVTMEVLLPTGEVIPNASKVLYWQGQLQFGGDYWIDVSSPTPAEFTLDISVTGGSAE
ncbi:MAG: protein kinase [Cyanobacteria bacterium P01_A01_bin.123]